MPQSDIVLHGLEANKSSLDITMENVANQLHYDEGPDRKAYKEKEVTFETMMQQMDGRS